MKKGEKTEAGGGFYQRIYEVVEKIPAGTVATYGQIAMLTGKPRAARQVGQAMSGASAERNLPCHRVVNRLGELAPDHAFGDKIYQRMMLESEGIGFLPNGRIDLRKHLWNGRMEGGE